MAGLLSLVLVAALTVAAGTASPVYWIAAGGAALVGLLVGLLVPERGGLVAALTAVPAVAMIVVRAAGRLDAPAILLAVTAAAVTLAAVGVVRRRPALITGGAVGAVIVFGAWVCLHLSLPADRTAGLGLLTAILAGGLSGQLALGRRRPGEPVGG